jgi:hypothetical protein
MKAFENITIRRKLASFRPTFPHDDHTTVENIEVIYDDVLEFSRPVVGRMHVFVNMVLSNIF